MAKLTDYVSYADAQRHFSKEALWDLFDGDRAHLNIAHECLDRHDRERVAVRIAHGTGGSESFTFGQLSDWSSRFANWLTRRGIAKGERVAIMLDPSLTFYAALFGIMKAGGVAVPLFTAFGPDGLAARLDDCAPALLLLTPEKPDLAGTGGIETVIADAALLAAVETEDTGFTPDTAASDMAMYQYTSGTSRALPEAVKHRHRAVVTVIIAALYATGIRPGDRYMCPSSPAWGHGLWPRHPGAAGAWGGDRELRRQVRSRASAGGDRGVRDHQSLGRRDALPDDAEPWRGTGPSLQAREALVHRRAAG